MVTPTFRSRTAEDRPQPYGLYLPRYAETVGSLLIFPINPAGENDTERFLFALWNALVLQRHFGVKVLMSDMAVPPLGKDEIPNLYVDNIPLGCRGLLPQNGLRPNISTDQIRRRPTVYTVESDWTSIYIASPDVQQR